MDPALVGRAAEALRLNINSDRLLDCPAMKPYEEKGRINYAKKGLATLCIGGGMGVALTLER